MLDFACSIKQLGDQHLFLKIAQLEHR